MTTKPVLLATCTSVRAETSLCNGVKASVQLPFRVDSPGTANYLCDSTTPASAVLKDGAAVYTPGLSERRGTTSKFYHGDALGSTRGITNSSQAVTDTVLYDGFGMTVSRTGTTPTPFGFVGKGQYQTDSDSGLMLLGHRYYDASVGRFISSDPAQAGDNWYAYCDNNPLTETDSQGLNGWLDDIGDALNKPLNGWEKGIVAGGTIIGGIDGMIQGGALGGTGGFFGGGGVGAIPGTAAGAAGGAGVGALAGRAAGGIAIALGRIGVGIINHIRGGPEGGGNQDGGNGQGGGANNQNPVPMRKKPGLSGKEASTDIPSFAKGKPPWVGETSEQFAERVLNGNYGPGNWSGKGAGSEYSKIKKSFRGYE